MPSVKNTHIEKKEQKPERYKHNLFSIYILFTKQFTYNILTLPICLLSYELRLTTTVFFKIKKATSVVLIYTYLKIDIINRFIREPLSSWVYLNIFLPQFRKMIRLFSYTEDKPSNFFLHIDKNCCLNNYVKEVKMNCI